MGLLNRVLPTLLFVGAVLQEACGSSVPPPRVAQQVDLARYMGTWHEIARLPFKYEEDCFGSSAEYKLLSERAFHVTNYCWYRSFFGPMRKTEAEARIPDPAVPAKIKLRLFWPVTTDYWIIYVSDDYREALVGTPNRKYLWILSRELTMDENTYAALVARAAIEGFDVSRLILTPQMNNSRAQTDRGRGEVVRP